MVALQDAGADADADAGWGGAGRYEMRGTCKVPVLSIMILCGGDTGFGICSKCPIKEVGL